MWPESLLYQSKVFFRLSLGGSELAGTQTKHHGAISSLAKFIRIIPPLRLLLDDAPPQPSLIVVRVTNHAISVEPALPNQVGPTGRCVWFLNLLKVS
jgi:hypothetical protein